MQNTEATQSKVYIVAGLHFGDEGKGTIVDYVCRSINAKAVVRYGGGPQAAHHVVLSNGVWHCFSHYGSGMFVQNCQSILSKYMVIYPQTLVNETNTLIHNKVKDPLKRLKIDLECYIITPYHQLISRIYQLLRTNRKGSTGLGVGRAIEDIYSNNPDYFPQSALLSPNLKNTCIQIKDLLDYEKFEPLFKKVFDQKTQLVSRLMKMSQEELIDALYHEKQRQSWTEKPKINPNSKKLVLQELISFTNKNSPKSYTNCLKFYEQFRNDYKACFVNTTEYIEKALRKGKNIVFEGSQGALLDPIYGFFPHTTKTLCTDVNVVKLLSQVKYKPIIKKIGVIRAYSHRHGAGPFVSNSNQFTKLLPQLHNKYTDWMGDLRIGPFDLVACRYGIQIFKPDLIAVTNIDRILSLPENLSTQYISEYILQKNSIPEQTLDLNCNYTIEQNTVVITHLKKLEAEKAYRNTTLVQILSKCQPKIVSWNILDSAKPLPERINSLVKVLEELLKHKICIVSLSPARQGKIPLIDL